MIAVPSFEQNQKHEIHSIFAMIVNTMMPATELGILSILLYASIVAVWEGFSVLPARYVELFVAMSFTSVQQFVLIMILGKTLGGYITHKFANSLLKKERLFLIMFTCSSSFIFQSIQQMICKRPFFYGLLIRMFFPSVLINFYLALTPLSKTKFVFIQFLHAAIMSYPSALFDYYGFLDKKFKMVDGQVRLIYTNHTDLVLKGLEKRMDIFKISLLICQLLGLIFLAIRMLLYNRRLSQKFFEDVKQQVIQINRAKGIEII